jgi:CRISPR-associated endonuclease/helicase Cas3
VRGEEALNQMWAKTGPNGTWHRLTYHLLDVAAVAQLLLDRHVARSVRRRLAGRVGLAAADFEVWCVFLAALHDFGKATPPFQVKFDAQKNRLKELGLPFPRRAENIPHGRMTAAFETRERLEGLGWSRGLAQQAARWVGGHHGVFPNDVKLDQARDHYGMGLWVEARSVLFGHLTALLTPPPNIATDQTLADVGLFVAGLTSVADWIGSMSEYFRFEAGDVAPTEYFGRALVIADAALSKVGWRPWLVGAERTFEQLFGFPPRPLQTAIVSTVAKANEQFFAIVEAPMGDGKTEAAFWAAHELGRRADHRGSYFALPTMATANQMFQRTTQFLERSYEGELSTQLLHGGAEFSDEFHELKLRAVVDDDAESRRLDEATNCGTVIAEEWFSKRKRGLLATFSVGTIDQALLGVLRTKHGFVRLFGLSGKTIVLDEVHAYDAYTSHILDRLVAWLKQLGASVLILSATLPKARREQLCAHWSPASHEPVNYPRISAFADGNPLSVSLPPPPARTLQVEHLDGDVDGALEWLVHQVENGGCAGLIVNTVNRAQQAARMARQKWPDLEVLLLHARFFAKDRQARETRLLEYLGRHGLRPTKLLVIGTQVLEQSLDIDFDVLVTDHAPVDLVLQRTGRLHRHSRPRPAGLSVPKLGIVRPEAGPKFGVHELIYEKAILLRTWVVLGQRSSLSIPSDIEPLIEQVYGASAPPGAPALAAEMAELDAKLKADIDELERDAENRLLAHPSGCVDDPFSNFGLPLDEENPELAQALQALTRLGEPSIPVAFLTDVAVTEREPSRAETRAVVERTLSISNKALFYELRKQPPPEAWKRSSWLRNTRVVHLENGRAQVGSKELIDDPALGLVITTPTPEDT